MAPKRANRSDQNNSVMILSAALAITNAVLFIVCRACSGCWDWLEPVPNGPLAGEWRLSEALFWFRKQVIKIRVCLLCGYRWFIL